jgi:hypothetical protein
MDLPPPTRAQASVWKAQALRDSRTKRIRNPFAQLFSNIGFLRTNGVVKTRDFFGYIDDSPATQAPDCEARDITDISIKA